MREGFYIKARKKPATWRTRRNLVSFTLDRPKEQLFKRIYNISYTNLSLIKGATYSITKTYKSCSGVRHTSKYLASGGSMYTHRL